MAGHTEFWVGGLCNSELLLSRRHRGIVSGLSSRRIERQQTPTLDEAEQERRKARQQLFQQAQGRPDVRWRSAQRLALVLAILYTLLVLIIVPEIVIPGQDVLGFLIRLVILLLFVFLAFSSWIKYFVVIPRYLKTLPERSAEELQKRLILGEITSGNE